jgi:mannose-6-phosphate isomerase-like protein (cupin superfamily)
VKAWRARLSITTPLARPRARAATSAGTRSPRSTSSTRSRRSSEKASSSDSIIRRTAPRPRYVHLHQEERFLVHEGVLRVRRGLFGSHLVGRGEEIAIPAGRPHTFRVESERARFTAEFTPPLRMADYLLELFGIDDPGLRDLARLARDYPAEHFYVALVPPLVQHALLRPFGPAPAPETA